MNQAFGTFRFPHSSMIQIGDQSLSAQKIIELMSPYISLPRVEKIEKVVRGRTFSVVSVLENIYDRGNMSAVMRSAEAMGFQSVHIIEPGDKFKKANRVTKGADKWLDVTQWKSTQECIGFLKSQSYKIYATHLDTNAKPIQDIDWSVPAALVLGNEKDGISQEMQSLCDETIIIPMQGFVQSFNISVAGAIALFHIHEQRSHKLGASGDLTPEQREILKALYFLRSAKNPERLIEKLLSRCAPGQKHD